MPGQCSPRRESWGSLLGGGAAGGLRGPSASLLSWDPSPRLQRALLSRRQASGFRRAAGRAWSLQSRLPLGIAKRTRSQSVLARAPATHYFEYVPLCDSLACIQSVQLRRHTRCACSTPLAALAPRIDPRQQPSCGDGVRCDEQRSPFSSTARRRRTRSPASAAATPTARRRPNPWRRAPAGRRASPRLGEVVAWAASSPF